MLVPFPIALLVFALVADVAYAVTGDEFYARMALWMVTSGLVTGVLAMLAGLVDFVALERPRQLRAGWIHAIGNGAARQNTRLALGSDRRTNALAQHNGNASAATTANLVMAAACQPRNA